MRVYISVYILAFVVIISNIRISSAFHAVFGRGKFHLVFLDLKHPVEHSAGAIMFGK
jgi:hypothetical protein